MTDANGRILGLTRENGEWHSADLISAASGDPVEGHTPYAYVRSDQVSAVVYLSSVGFGALEVHELALRHGHWTHTNLSAVAGAPACSGGSVTGHVRADGVDAVVYRGVDRHLHEIARADGTAWTHTDLTLAAGAPTGPGLAGRGDIAALARPDGATMVVCVSEDGKVRSLRRGPDGRWTSQALTRAADPAAHGTGLAAYVRPDDVTAIVYRGRDQRIYELTPDTLHDLTARAGGTCARGALHAHLRADGTATVVYEGTDFHRHELALQAGTWSHTDLTDGSAEELAEVRVEAGLVLDHPVSQSPRLLSVARLG